MSAVFAPVGFKHGAVGAQTAPPPPPKPFPGWIGSSQSGGRGVGALGETPRDQTCLRHMSEVFAKTTLCRFYPRCNKGDACRFAHAPEELRHRPNMTKTRICSGFYNGRCKLPADMCDFAHGDEELRPWGVPYFGPANSVTCRSHDFGDVTSKTTGSTRSSFRSGGSDRRHANRNGSTTASGSRASSNDGDATPPVAAGSEPELLGDGPDAEAGPVESEGEASMPGFVAASPEVNAIFAEWMARIRKVNDSLGFGGDTSGRLPTHGECLAALMKATPEYYED